ncbi:MAG: hypothetical protein KDD70_08700 [Bdellovibrionales bacterium]|nr:hypothetical protein [Bdellovibrionales bacterium]
MDIGRPNFEANLRRIERLLEMPPADQGLFTDTLATWMDRLRGRDVPEARLEEFFSKAISTVNEPRALALLISRLGEMQDSERREESGEKPLSAQSFQTITNVIGDKILATGNRDLLGHPMLLRALGSVPSKATAQVLSAVIEDRESDGRVDLLMKKLAVSTLGTYGALALSELHTIERFAYARGVVQGDELDLRDCTQAALKVIEAEIERRDAVHYPVLGFETFESDRFQSPADAPGHLVRDLRYCFKGQKSATLSELVPSECRARVYRSSGGEDLVVFSWDSLSFGAPPTFETGFHAVKLEGVFGKGVAPRVFLISPLYGGEFEALEVDITRLDTFKVSRQGFEPNSFFREQFGINNPGFISYHN